MKKKGTSAPSLGEVRAEIIELTGFDLDSDLLEQKDAILFGAAEARATLAGLVAAKKRGKRRNRAFSLLIGRMIAQAESKWTGSLTALQLELPCDMGRSDWDRHRRIGKALLKGKTFNQNLLTTANIKTLDDEAKDLIGFKGRASGPGMLSRARKAARSRVVGALQKLLRIEDDNTSSVLAVVGETLGTSVSPNSEHGAVDRVAPGCSWADIVTLRALTEKEFEALLASTSDTSRRVWLAACYLRECFGTADIAALAFAGWKRTAKPDATITRVLRSGAYRFGKVDGGLRFEPLSRSTASTQNRVLARRNEVDAAYLDRVASNLTSIDESVTSFELWRGPSAITGDEIVLLANLKSQNQKSGAFVQLYVLRTDLPPDEASAQGLDDAVCGDCPMRRSLGGKCYVQLTNGLKGAWKSWRGGTGYVPTPVPAGELLAGLPVRLTAYGDVRALPHHLVEEIVNSASKVRAYTEGWREVPPSWSEWCMASVHSEAEALEATELGWTTFRDKDETFPRLQNEIPCTFQSSGRMVRCSECKLCDPSRKSVVIDRH